jgi:6-pyruvoyltetrahydropterin/6-carboxytetrahydropterin synthase
MPVYRVRARARFEAAHRLLSYHGKPERTHGHSWRVEALLETSRLDAEGMAFDFVELKDALRSLASKFDHADINEIAPFDVVTPTTENLARWFFHALRALLPHAPLREIALWEGPDCCAAYAEPEGSPPATPGGR